jgi:hypothetical protein
MKHEKCMVILIKVIFLIKCYVIHIVKRDRQSKKSIMMAMISLNKVVLNNKSLVKLVILTWLVILLVKLRLST